MGASDVDPKDGVFVVVEGQARVLQNEYTFFNPAQKLNRDLSVEVIKECFRGKERIRILDAMSATGLRGIRYLKEISNSVVYLNDVSDCALDAINANIVLNGMSPDMVRHLGADIQSIRVERENSARVSVVRSDCNVLMASLPCFFDVIDIDPFGSCSEYIDNALRSIRHGGLVCLTATDKAVLCTNEKKCKIKYSTAIPRRMGMNEVPLRTIVSLVSRHASKFGASVEPVVCLSVDFYVRVFVRILRRNPQSVIKNNSYVFFCDCHKISEVDGRGGEMSSVCSNCKGRMKLCGPFWNGPLHDGDVVHRMLDGMGETTDKRLLGILRCVGQEISTLFYYEIPRLCSILKINTMRLADLMNALANLGHSVSFTHSELNAIKTDAPVETINKILLVGHSGRRGEDSGISFEENRRVRALRDMELFKGLQRSGMGPLPLPKKQQQAGAGRR